MRCPVLRSPGADGKGLHRFKPGQGGVRWADYAGKLPGRDEQRVRIRIARLEGQAWASYYSFASVALNVFDTRNLNPRSQSLNYGKIDAAS